MVVVETCQHQAYSGNLVVSIQLHGVVVMQIPPKYAAKKKNKQKRDIMIDENAPITLLELKDLKKFADFEQDLNPQPLHYRCNALPTELSKPHESGIVWIGALCSVDVILASSI